MQLDCWLLLYFLVSGDNILRAHLVKLEKSDFKVV